MMSCIAAGARQQGRAGPRPASPWLSGSGWLTAGTPRAALCATADDSETTGLAANSVIITKASGRLYGLSFSLSMQKRPPARQGSRQ